MNEDVKKLKANRAGGSAIDSGVRQVLRVLIDLLDSRSLKSLVAGFSAPHRSGAAWEVVQECCGNELEDRRLAFAAARERVATKRAEFLNPRPLNSEAEAHFIVQASRRRMYTDESVWRLAVLEVEPGLKRVSMISPRARGCRRVIAVWERRSRMNEDELARVQALAAKLNEGRPLAKCLADCDADCILPTREELARASRSNRSEEGSFVQRLSRMEIRTRAA